MFKSYSITYGNLIIYDTKFDSKIIKLKTGAVSCMLKAVVDEYKMRNLPVASNIALFYLQRNEGGVYIKTDFKRLAQKYGEEYIKYAECSFRHYTRLRLK